MSHFLIFKVCVERNQQEIYVEKFTYPLFDIMGVSLLNSEIFNDVLWRMKGNVEYKVQCFSLIRQTFERANVLGKFAKQHYMS